MVYPPLILYFLHFLSIINLLLCALVLFLLLYSGIFYLYMGVKSNGELPGRGCGRHTHIPEGQGYYLKRQW